MQILQLGFAKLGETATVAHSRGGNKRKQSPGPNESPAARVWPTVLFLSEEPQANEVRLICKAIGQNYRNSFYTNTFGRTVVGHTLGS